MNGERRFIISVGRLLRSKAVIVMLQRFTARCRQISSDTVSPKMVGLLIW